MNGSNEAPPPAATSPRVSIGVPVYNGGRFLGSALDSLLGQTFRNIELIISDNASTDQTQRICADYLERDSRVRYIRQPHNIGAPRNWNAVAEQASGEYFKWATANDECAPTMLERCLQVMESDPSAVLVQGRTCLVDEESDRREEYARDLALLMARPSDRFRALYDQLALNNGQSGLIRMSALRRTRLDRTYLGGDFALMSELAFQGRFVVVPEVLLYRRMGTETFSRELTGEQARQFYDPLSRGLWIGNRLRLHLDVLRSIATANLDTRERAAALAVALRRAVWDRSRIWSELRPSWLSR